MPHRAFNFDIPVEKNGSRREWGRVLICSIRVEQNCPVVGWANSMSGRTPMLGVVPTTDSSSPPSSCPLLAKE